MLIPLAARRGLQDARGFTLIEALVGIVAGVVVIGAMYSILEVSLHQSSRLSDVAQATQGARTTMTRIVDELHSVCIAPAFKPVQANSNDHELIVIDAYSEAAEIPAGATTRKDKIVWDEKAKTLTDYSYRSNGGAWPNYTFESEPTPSKGVRIGENISKAENENKEVLPVFGYFKYATKASTIASSPSSTLNEATPVTGTLTAEQAESVASVLVSFRTAPTSNSTESARSVDLSTQVTFAFSAPNSEATIKAAPCE